MRTFELLDEDEEKIDKWIEEQLVKGPRATFIGGQFHYKFIPTSIGTFIYVYNELTGDELNVTEDVNW